MQRGAEIGHPIYVNEIYPEHYEDIAAGRSG
jgi:hypothetical protein